MTQLQLIKGTVSELQITKGYEDFVFSSAGKSAVGAAAIGAAAMGQIFNSTALATSSGGAEISMEYFTCLLDGQRVTGKFYKVGFKNNEEIEMIVQPGGEVVAVLAARSPTQRLIWMLPYYERGEVAHRRNHRKWTWITSTAGCVLPFGFWIMMEGEGAGPWWFLPTEMLGTFVICFAVNVFARSFFTHYGYATTPILEALGFDDPVETDLYKIDRAAQKKIQQATGKIAPLTESWTFRY